MNLVQMSFHAWFQLSGFKNGRCFSRGHGVKLGVNLCFSDSAGAISVRIISDVWLERAHEVNSSSCMAHQL